MKLPKLARIRFLVIPLFCLLVLVLSLRGIPGNPTPEELNTKQWQSDGPFELSPERGRFALTFSFVENKSFFFSIPIARFALPDLGYKNGHFVSLFAPAVSFIVAPGFLVGKIFGISQIGAFFVISLFALLNAMLIRQIAIKLGANALAAIIASLVFIFATPAFPYAVSLYQHHISTFLILCSLYILLKWNNIWSVSFIWFLCAASIPVDYPNLFLMFPIAIISLGRIIFIKIQEKNITVNFKIAGLFTFITILFPLFFFLWFNQDSYGNPFQLSGTVPSVREIDINGKPTAPSGASKNYIEKYNNSEKQQRSAIGFFKTRYLLNVFYIHLISPDRGVIYYTPVILFGVIGAIIAYKKRIKYLSLLLSIIAVNLLLYSMWGDPWGGWAFGSRYLIPSYALFSIFIAFFLTRFHKSILFLSIFFLIMAYSICVNTLGAITSSANPPQTEVLQLEKLSGIVQKYTYARNYDFLMSGNSKSFMFQTYAHKYLTAFQYYGLLVLIIIGVSQTALIKLYFSKEEHDQV